MYYLCCISIYFLTCHFLLTSVLPDCNLSSLHDGCYVVKEGSTTRINIPISGVPYPTATWKKGDVAKRAKLVKYVGSCDFLVVFRIDMTPRSVEHIGQSPNHSRHVDAVLVPTLATFKSNQVFDGITLDGAYIIEI